MKVVPKLSKDEIYILKELGKKEYGWLRTDDYTWISRTTRLIKLGLIKETEKRDNKIFYALNL